MVNRQSCKTVKKVQKGTELGNWKVKVKASLYFLKLYHLRYLILTMCGSIFVTAFGAAVISTLSQSGHNHQQPSNIHQDFFLISYECVNPKSIVLQIQPKSTPNLSYSRPIKQYLRYLKGPCLGILTCAPRVPRDHASKETNNFSAGNFLSFLWHMKYECHDVEDQQI